MITRSLTVVVALLCVFAVSSAQPTEAQSEESNRILKKIQQMELYNQLLPVLFKPDEARAFLPILERHRAEARKTELFEHKTLRSLEIDLDRVIKEAQEKGKVPDPKVMSTVFNWFRTFAMKRKALVDDTAEELIRTMRQTLNEGQVRAAMNAFNPKEFDPTLDPETMTEDEKLALWVKVVMMDSLAYDIMLGFSRK